MSPRNIALILFAIIVGIVGVRFARRDADSSPGLISRLRQSMAPQKVEKGWDGIEMADSSNPARAVPFDSGDDATEEANSEQSPSDPEGDRPRNNDSTIPPEERVQQQRPVNSLW
jgi:hypothetical protein